MIQTVVGIVPLETVGVKWNENGGKKISLMGRLRERERDNQTVAMI